MTSLIITAVVVGAQDFHIKNCNLHAHELNLQTWECAVNTADSYRKLKLVIMGGNQWVDSV